MKRPEQNAHGGASRRATSSLRRERSKCLARAARPVQLESWRRQRRRRRSSQVTIESRESSDQREEDAAEEEEEDGDDDAELQRTTHEYGWDPPWTVHRAPGEGSAPQRRARSDLASTKILLAAATAELDELKMVRCVTHNLVHAFVRGLHVGPGGEVSPCQGGMLTLGLRIRTRKSCNSQLRGASSWR